MSQINYQLFPLDKNKPWILLIHGLFGNLDNLSALRRGFNHEYNVISIDLPDHGKSLRTTEFSFTHYADLVTALLSEINLPKVTIVGHSLGGKVAMQIALNQPNLVENLIVLDIAPVAYLPRHNDVFLGLEGVPLGSITSRKLADTYLAKHVHEASTRQFLLKGLYQDDDGWHWYFNLSLLKRDYARIIAEINANATYLGPTLFIKGELSDYLLAEHKGKILSLFPNSQSKLIGGTGHWLHAEKPLICIKMIELFIKKSALKT